MLIDVLAKSRSNGFLGRELPGSFAYFSNNNLCLRRSALDEIGPYDERCLLSEDVEICGRVSRSRWVMFLCPEAIVHHRSRDTVLALLSQWWGYGRFIPYVFRKYNRGQWEVFIYRDTQAAASSPGELPYRQLLYLEKMPGTLCIFITPFLTFHVAFALAAIAFAAGAPAFAWPLFAGALYFLWQYLKVDFAELSSVVQVFELIAVRYLVNIAFLSAHILSGLRLSTLYLSPVVCDRSEALAAPRNSSATAAATESGACVHMYEADLEGARK